MKIAVVQFEPKIGNTSFNLQKMLKYITNIDADLIIFPELATSGYFIPTKDEIISLSLNIESAEIQELINLSNQSNKGIVFGFPEKSEKGNFNSSMLILPNGSHFIYRKTHLFFKERFLFTEGDTGFFNVYWKQFDINIGMMICYDWRFPESARTLALKGADLIVCPSNLVTDVWHISMPSRALENKVYFAVANRIGIETINDESCKFLGESAIWSYNGSILTKASKSNEEVLISEIEPQKTRDKSFNPYNDIFKDRKPEFYF